MCKGAIIISIKRQKSWLHLCLGFCLKKYLKHLFKDTGYFIIIISARFLNINIYFLRKYEFLMTFWRVFKKE